MKKRQLQLATGILVGIAAFALCAYSAPKLIESRWAAVPIRIDGATQDWQGAPMLVDKASNAEYALSNDGNYLYILFVFKSIPAMSTYEISGMKVYYDFGGKKGKNEGFHFVTKEITPDQYIAYLEKNGIALAEEKKAEIKKQKAFLVFEGEPIGPANAVGAPSAGPLDPPIFRHHLKPNLSVVEFRIPLARIVGASGAVAAPGSTLKLGFEWGGMTSAMRSAYMARMADSNSRASGDRGGGDLGQALKGNVDDSASLGGMGGRPDPRTKKHSFWIDVRLAAQAN
jgi:hypothetical protein